MRLSKQLCSLCFKFSFIRGPIRLPLSWTSKSGQDIWPITTNNTGNYVTIFLMYIIHVCTYYRSYMERFHIKLLTRKIFKLILVCIILSTFIKLLTWYFHMINLSEELINQPLKSNSSLYFRLSRKEIVLFDLKAIFFSVSYFFSRILSKWL